MNRTVSQTGQAILICTAIYVESFAWASTIPDDSAPFHVIEFRSRGIRYQPAAWLARQLSEAERMAYSRATRRLETQGMIRRITEPGRDRVICVQPTLAGIQAALQHNGPLFQIPALVESLSQTDWGADFAHNIHRPHI